VFAIVKSGEYWNRIRELVAEYGTPEGLTRKIQHDFDQNFDAAAQEFIKRYKGGEDEDLDQKTDLCLRFATQYAVRKYVEFVRAGYYEGAVGEDTLTRKA
jgi:hypothetical protein